MSKHRKAQGHKPPGDKKQKSNGKKEVQDTKEVKDKIVAAELGAAVLREEAPKPAPVPVARPEPPAPPKEAVTAKAPAPPPLAAKTKAPEPPRHLLETAVDTFERTFRAAGQGTVEVNRKLLDFTRANVSSGFDFAMSLASASSPVQIMQLQMSYWDERLKVLASQAEELRALSADLVAKANEPIREHIRRAQLA
jgi:hypothetical protein